MKSLGLRFGIAALVLMAQPLWAQNPKAIAPEQLTKMRERVNKLDLWAACGELRRIVRTQPKQRNDLAWETLSYISDRYHVSRDHWEVITKGHASIGMSECAAAAAWGRPEKINRTTSARGTRAQWVYGGHNYLYFDDGVLTTVQN